MKKSLVMCGVAALALASCTKNEVLDVNEGRLIGFNSFVENNTRAVTEVSSLTDFYVFANFGTGGTYDGQSYNNESKNHTDYWKLNTTYKFGTYANGDAGRLTNVSFDPASGDHGTLTFTGYAPQDDANDGKDLVAAVNTKEIGASVDPGTKVDLTFYHLLSQVKFTFKTTDNDSYTLKIHDLRIEGAVSKATCTYDGTVNWNTTDGTEKNNYKYDEISDIADALNNYQGSSVETVIPQAGTDKLTVKFTATITGDAFPPEGKTATFSADLGYSVAKAVDTDNTWVPGYRYNYIATINADQIDPGLEDQKIDFNVKVDGWKDANETDNGELPKF